MRRRAAAVCLALCALALAWAAATARAATVERPAWWDGRWGWRVLLTFDERSPRPGGAAAYVWLHARQAARSDGSEIVVVGPSGRAVPCDVVYSGPEGRHLVAFETRDRADGFYAVYYGNPRPGGLARQRPQAGLLLQTFGLPEGADASSWPAAQRALAAATPQGAAFWERVFDAHNPFGPPSMYASVYTGWLRARTDGEHQFATTSDHSSFLLVDGRLVAGWPGPHNIQHGRRGEHGGTVELRAGLHEFQYVAFSFESASRCLAAWLPPGAHRWHVVPPGAFPPIAEANVYESEQYGQPLCADFTAAPDAYCEAGGARMVAVGFSSTSTAAGGLIDRYHWDFGDGQVSSEPAPTHVYLQPRTYGVTLSVLSTAGQRAVCSKRVQVRPIRDDLSFTRRKMQRFYEAVRGYDLDALGTPALLAAWKFFRELDETGAADRAADVLDARRQQLGPERRHELLMALGHRAARERDADRAERHFALAAEAAPPRDWRRRFEARQATAELYAGLLADPARARAAWTAMEADFPRASRRQRRTLRIRVGDTWRAEGNAVEARRAYAEAERALTGRETTPDAVARAAMLREAESYLARGLPDEAIARLDELLWHYPTMALEGRAAVLRAQALLVKGEPAAARREAEALLRCTPAAEEAPRLHMVAADACGDLGLTEEAADHYRTVLEEFPESPHVLEARNALRRAGF